jgi:hypothetical protein
MSGSYANLYRRARQAIEEDAEMKLGRALNDHERNIFRSCGTLTALEALGMTVYMAENAEELSTKLAATSMVSRFGLALDELVVRLGKFLARPVTPVERRQLSALGNIEALWDLEQHLHSVPSSERETTFVKLLQH